jgi:UDP-2-acetamido-3-amino-2,3-dideoxy-glucuronate N-acetyltransferase
LGRRRPIQLQRTCIRSDGRTALKSMADYFAHESCYIDEGCEIGKGTTIRHFTHVMPRARIRRTCNIGQNVVISPDVVVGDNV